MDTNEKRRVAFANVMSYMQSRHGFGSAAGHLISSFDWNSVKKVVDIGGGLGDTALEIIKNTTETTCVVQDLAPVVGQAKATELASVEDRLSFMAHNFFEDQPILDADVFFLRWVLHDWSDDSAVKILRGLISVLKPGQHVIIQEFIVPESGTVPFYFEKTIRCEYP
jgi:ubiquinone/menaquinone biosynthesis C-methylase UbiE